MMKRITKDCINRLNDVSLFSILPAAEGKGMTRYCRCPSCNAEGKVKGKQKGLAVVDDPVKRKRLIKCNSCGLKAGGGAVNVMMTVTGLEFIEACHKIADMTGIQIEYEKERSEDTGKGGRPDGLKNDRHSFCFRQLEASGLTYDDVKATVYVGNDLCQVSPFRKGALDPFTGKVDELKDEMLILYYDLNGKRKKCIPTRNKTREVDYTRVRWSNPEAHKDKSDKSIKYQTIAGAKTEFYFPQRIRTLYQTKTPFDTLFIQEGEKKAEKACKHGINSIAIQGIGNIGRKEEGLSDEIQYLVQTCKVKNIVMLMDSDWNDLARHIRKDDRVDVRPLSFARALIKFKRYVGTLAQCGLDVDIWFAHVNENENGDKGIDDLLVNTLKEREDGLRKDIDAAMTAHDGHGEYIDCLNVTSYSDMKIMGLWNLNNREDFFSCHHDELMKLKSFKFGDVFFTVTDGKIAVSTEYGSGKEFWSISYDDKQRKKIEPNLLHMRSFLTANGFRSIKLPEGKRGLVKIESGVIRSRDEYEAREFVLNYVFKATKDEAVHLIFAESIDSRLSTAKLYQLEQLQTNAGKPTGDAQRFYFLDSQIEITDKDIETSKLIGPVWEENLIKRNFVREKIFSEFRPDGNGSFDIELTPAGEECEFLRYLMNTCDMWKGRALTEQQDHEFRLHIANRITCIGYLLRDYRDMGEDKAIVAMDATMVDVGESNGRSGKSLIGKAINQFIAQTEINGPTLENNDPYIFSGVRNQTKNIFIDDIKQTFDFSNFKHHITGSLNVNIKQGGRFVIPYEESPKFYITSNHAVENLDSSCLARIEFMSFSNYYNRQFTPEKDFGHLFFVGWDERQWQLFDNLMAECVMLYMRSNENRWGDPNKGIIRPPMEDLNRRTYRQEMGENFLLWAELYYSPDGSHINRRETRKSVYEAYLAEFNIKSTQMTSKTFTKKLIAFCKYSGYNINAHKRSKEGYDFTDHHKKNPGESFIGGRDSSGGVEYLTITATDYVISAAT